MSVSMCVCVCVRVCVFDTERVRERERKREGEKERIVLECSKCNYRVSISFEESAVENKTFKDVQHAQINPNSFFK